MWNNQEWMLLYTKVNSEIFVIWGNKMSGHMKCIVLGANIGFKRWLQEDWVVQMDIFTKLAAANAIIVKKGRENMY